MKILFSNCYNDIDYNVKLGIDWYSFRPMKGCRKDLEGSGGFAIDFYAIGRKFSITWIKDYAAYKARIDYRHSDNLKGLSERLKNRMLVKTGNAK